MTIGIKQPLNIYLKKKKKYYKYQQILAIHVKNTVKVFNVTSKSSRDSSLYNGGNDKPGLCEELDREKCCIEKSVNLNIKMKFKKEEYY